jgi:hypothetical protein
VLTDALTVSQIVEIDNYLTAFLPTNALRVVTTFTATAGQTTFAVTYTQGLIDVFYNGSNLAESEYTATNGTSVVLATACQVNDIVVVYAYSYAVGAYSGISGSGTTNYVSKFTSSTVLGDSLFYDNGTQIGLGTTTPLGLLHLYQSAATTRMVMDGDAGQSKIITFRTSGLQRFGMYVNNTAESGSNVGSDFQVRAYNDAGTLLSTPLFIKRSTGNVGVNTITPAYKLDVNGTGNFSGALSGTSATFSSLEVFDNSNSGILKLSRDAGGQRGQLQFGRNNGGSFQVTGMIGSDSDSASPNNGTLYFYTSNSSGVSTQRLIINGTGAATFSSSVQSDGLFKSMQGVFQVFAAGSLRGGLYNFASAIGSGTDYTPTITSETGLYFCMNGNIIRNMSLLSNGNLLIGTTTDGGQRLQVSGNLAINNTLSSPGNLIETAGNNVYLRPASGFSVILDTGAGINVGGYVQGGTVYTQANTVSVAFNTFQTIYTLQSGVGGIYLFQISLDGQSTTDWSAAAIVMTAGGSNAIILSSYNSSLVVFQLSGMNLQIRQQGTNPSITMNYRVLKIS